MAAPTRYKLIHHLYRPDLKYCALLLTSLVFVAASSNTHTASVRVIDSPIDFGTHNQPILKILASKNGLLWIAKQEGVSVFDGSDLSIHQRKSSVGGTLPSTNITKLSESPDGQIVIATEDRGIYLLDETSDSFTKLSLNKVSKPQKDDVSTAIYTHDGALWAGYKSGGISRIDPHTTKISYYPLEGNVRVSDLHLSNRGVLYAINADGAAYRLNDQGDNFVLIDTECENSMSQTEELSTSEGGYLWIGSRRNGLNILEVTAGTCSSIALPSVDGNLSTEYYVNDLFYDASADRTWVSTDQGLYVFDSTNYAYHFHVGNSVLLSNEVGEVSKGTDGLFWISTYSGLQVAIESPFELFSPTLDPRLRSVIDIQDDGRGGLWVATYEKILHKNPDRNSHTLPKALADKKAFINKGIMSLAAGTDELWLGYRAAGAQRYSFETNELTSFRTDSTRPISSNAISCLLLLDSGDMVVGTYGGGINFISSDGKVSILSREEIAVSHPSNFVVMLHQTSDKTIWVGTEGGLFQLETESLSLIPQHVQTPAESDERNQPTVWSMTESTDGKLWFGTQHHGLFRRGTTSERGIETTEIQPFSLNPTPSSLIIYSVENDNLDYLWLATNQGILRVNPRGGQTRRYSAAHGLQESDFQKGASHKDSQGRLYFGGSNGYNRFNPADVKEDAKPSEVILTDVNIAGQRPTSRSNMRDVEEIELTAEDYFVTFTFSVLDFLYPRGNQYRYKLVGFDPEWIESGTRNTATYTKLPAGFYTLRVQGANSEGIWNREGISVDLRVLPSKYLSWWAYCIYSLVAAALLALGLRDYRNSVHKQEYKLAAEHSNYAAMRAVDELHDQIDYQDELVKAVYDHNVNTLELIRQCIDLESNSSPEYETRKATVNDRKRVAALKTLEDCLFYQNETLLADLHKFTECLLVELTEQSDIDSGTIVTINGVSPRKLPVGVASPLALILFELLENALTHAFDTSSPVNYLEVETTWPENNGRPGTTMVLMVRDSGKGLPENSHPETITASGLAIVHHLVRELSGEISFDSRRGTSVTITIPDPLGDPW